MIHLGRAFAAFFALSGCAYHGSGVVRPAAEGEGVELQQLDGTTLKLALPTGSEPLGYLDGHIVRVEGSRAGRTLTVRRWSLVEGLSGMPVYVGVVQRMGSGVGLVDRQTGEPLALDDRASATLAPWIGRVVLVEGYGTGPGQLTATAWRPLDEALTP